MVRKLELRDQGLHALPKAYDPELHRSLTKLKMVQDVQVEGNSIEMTIALTVID